MIMSTKWMRYFYQNLVAGLLIFSVTACVASPVKSETTGEYLDNSVLTAQVKSKLLADPLIKSLPITVVSYKGRVLLSGFVDSASQEQRAVSIARSVEGVQVVEDKLAVK